MRAKINKGFTLIELLVVVSIIAFLASIVLVALANGRQKARDAKRVADINQMAKAMELYFNGNFSYPTNSQLVTSNGVLKDCTGASSLTPGCTQYLVPKYLVKFPTAPTPPDSLVCSSPYGGGIANDYQYAGTGGGNTVSNYTITFCIGNKVGAISAGVHTLTQGGFR